MLDRRSFLKAGCTATAVFAFAGLAGCSSNNNAQPANNSSANSESEEPNKSEETNMNEQPSTSQSPSAPAQPATGAATAVVYFSCTGNTQTVAEKIAQATGGELMRIQPEQPYTSADLDYNSDCRANTEQNDAAARPAIAAPVPNVADANTIYLGYPIWWGKAPRIILTFLDGADTAGKTIIPFCTSGSSPISGSIAEIQAAAPSASWKEGRRFSASASQQEIDSWVAAQ